LRRRGENPIHCGKEQEKRENLRKKKKEGKGRRRPEKLKAEVDGKINLCKKETLIVCFRG
jgi:hypothetical protein